MYTTFTELPNGLLIQLTEEGKTEAPELLKRKETENYFSLWWDINEHAFCNGFNEVKPEHIGALTSAPIIANGIIDEETTQEELDNTNIYWFPDYAVRDELEELLTKGEVFFPKA